MDNFVLSGAHVVPAAFHVLLFDSSGVLSVSTVLTVTEQVQWCLSWWFSSWPVLGAALLACWCVVCISIFMITFALLVRKERECWFLLSLFDLSFHTAVQYFKWLIHAWHCWYAPASSIDISSWVWLARWGSPGCPGGCNSICRWMNSNVPFPMFGYIFLLPSHLRNFTLCINKANKMKLCPWKALGFCVCKW